MRMHARVGQDVLDHPFGGCTSGLVLLEDNKHFQSSMYISSYLSIHIDLSHTPYFTVERNIVEEQSVSDLCRYQTTSIPMIFAIVYTFVSDSLYYGDTFSSAALNTS